jgi:hypothetical protein
LVPSPDTKNKAARCQWFTPVILATQEAEIRRIMVQKQLVRPSLEKTHHIKRAGGVAQGEALSSSPSTEGKNKQTNMKTTTKNPT